MEFLLLYGVWFAMALLMCGVGAYFLYSALFGDRYDFQDDDDDTSYYYGSDGEDE